MGIGRLLAMCKREEQPEDNRGKVCLANGEKYVITHTQTLRVRDVCIEIAKLMGIAPVALDFFTLMTTDCEHCLRPNRQTRQECTKENDHYLNPKRLLHEEECLTKVFFFRLAFKAIPGPDVKMVDKGAFAYFVMQCRWDYLNGRITDLNKKDHLTLLVLESIIRGHENNVNGKDVLDNPKKYGLMHMFIDTEFSVREIKNHLKKQISQFRTCQEDVDKAKNSFLCVLEGVADFGITKIVVHKFYLNSNASDEVYQVEWEIIISANGLKKRRTYKDEGDFDVSERGQAGTTKDEIISDYKDIEYLEIKQSESSEIIHISRMQGFLEVISVGKSMIKKESLITLIEGFYRLLVNQYKALTKYESGLELPMPSTPRREFEIHGPIERKKAEALLKAVDCPNGDRTGVHMIRRSRQKFDSYNLSFVNGSEIRHYEVVMSPTGCYGIANGPQFDSVAEMLEFYKTAQADFPTTLKKYCPIPREGLCALFDEQIVVEAPRPPSTSRPINPEYQFVQIRNMELQKLNHTFTCGNFEDRFFKARWLKGDDSGCQEVFCRRLAPSRTEKFKDKVISSAEKMSSLVHRNLVQFHGVCFFNDQNTYLAFEWIPSGTLDDYLIKEADVTVETIITFAAQISEACMYLHQNNYVHGWLAAHNVLVVSNEQVKVSDVSVPCLREEDLLLQASEEANRSPWKARECFLGRPYSKESDVWAFGVVLWEMFMKTKPFQNMTDEMIIKVFQQDHHLRCPKWCPEEVGKIMKSCWFTEPQRRPTFASIVIKLRSISANLSAQEKHRSIPQTVDENFTIEPLMMNKQFTSIAPVEEEMPCTSSYQSGNHGNSGGNWDDSPSKDHHEPYVNQSSDNTELDFIPEKEPRGTVWSPGDELPTKDSQESYVSSSSTNSEFDPIPEKATQGLVWSPEEIEMKRIQRKYPRTVSMEEHEQTTYCRIGQEDLREALLRSDETPDASCSGNIAFPTMDFETPIENEVTNGVSVEDKPTEEEPSEDQPTKHEVLEDKPVVHNESAEPQLTEDRPTEDGTTNDNLTDHRPTEDQPLLNEACSYEAQVPEEKPTEDRMTKENSTDDGPTEDRTNEHEATEYQSTEHEATEDQSTEHEATEDQSLLSEASSDEAQDQTNADYFSMRELDYVGFLACQLGPGDTSGDQRHNTISEVESEPSHQETIKVAADVDETSDEVSSCPIENLDPFAPDSEKRAALMFSNLDQGKSGDLIAGNAGPTNVKPLVKQSHPSTYTVLGKQPDRRIGQASPSLKKQGNTYGYVKSPYPSQKTNGIYHTSFLGHGTIPPSSSISGRNLGAKPGNTTSSSEGLFEFSKLDPFATSITEISEDSSSELSSSGIGSDKGVEVPLLQGSKPTQTGRSPFSKPKHQVKNFDPKMRYPALNRLKAPCKAEKDVDQLPLLNGFASYLERDPFSEILTSDYDQPTNSISPSFGTEATDSQVKNPQTTIPLSVSEKSGLNDSSYRSTTAFEVLKGKKDVSNYVTSSGSSTTPTGVAGFPQKHPRAFANGRATRSGYVSVSAATSRRVVATASRGESTCQTATSDPKDNIASVGLPSFSERDPFSEMLTQARDVDKEEVASPSVRGIHQATGFKPLGSPAAMPKALGSRISRPQASRSLASGSLVSGPLASGPLASRPLASGPLASKYLASGPLASRPLASGPLASRPLASGPLASRPLANSEPLLSRPLSSRPLTSGSLASRPLASGHLTSGPMASGPQIWQSQALITQASKPLTSQPLTSGPLTSTSPLINKTDGSPNSSKSGKSGYVTVAALNNHERTTPSQSHAVDEHRDDSTKSLLSYSGDFAIQNLSNRDIFSDILLGSGNTPEDTKKSYDTSSYPASKSFIEVASSNSGNVGSEVKQLAKDGCSRGAYSQVPSTNYQGLPDKNKVAKKSNYTQLFNDVSHNQAPAVPCSSGDMGFQDRDPFREIGAGKTLETESEPTRSSPVITDYVGKSDPKRSSPAIFDYVGKSEPKSDPKRSSSAIFDYVGKSDPIRESEPKRSSPVISDYVGKNEPKSDPKRSSSAIFDYVGKSDPIRESEPKRSSPVISDYVGKNEPKSDPKRSSSAISDYVGKSEPKRSSPVISDYVGKSEPKRSSPVISDYVGKNEPKSDPKRSSSVISDYVGKSDPKRCSPVISDYAGKNEPKRSSPAISDYVGKNEPKRSSPAISDYAGKNKPKRCSPVISDYAGKNEPKQSSPVISDYAGKNEPKRSSPVISDYAGKNEPKRSSPVITDYVGTSPSQAGRRNSAVRLVGVDRNEEVGEKISVNEDHDTADVLPQDSSSGRWDPFAELSRTNDDPLRKAPEESGEKEGLPVGRRKVDVPSLQRSVISADDKNDRISNLIKAVRREPLVGNTYHLTSRMEPGDKQRHTFQVSRPDLSSSSQAENRHMASGEVSRRLEEMPERNPPPGNDNTDKDKQKASRRVSDIDSAYAKIGINTYQMVVNPRESSDETVLGAVGGEDPAVELEEENETVPAALDEATVVDPFNISAAAESIRNLGPSWSEPRPERKKGARNTDVFEESMKSHQIPFNNLTFNDMEKNLGQGAFGVVRRAKFTRTAQHKTRPSTDVAVKCLKDNATEIYKNSFKQEAVNLMKLDNKFIVKFLGISYDDEGKMLLVTELVPQGSLDSYLKDPKNLRILGTEVLLQFAIQITMGMQYLESKKLVHRDLAARNILVATESHVKISDFGLSRIYDDEYYRSRRVNQKLPIRWLAPECLEQKKFTVNSDVWSLGVTLWEMFSYGKRPYEGVTFKTATELIDYLKEGNQLERPQACPEEIYVHIRECWHLPPTKRISFFLLKTFLEEILKEKYSKKPYFM